MAKKDNIDKQVVKKNASTRIEKMMKSIVSQKDSLHRSTYGVGDTTSKELDRDIVKITNVLNDIINDKEHENGSIIGQLSQFSEKLSSDKSRGFKEMQKILEDENNMDLISSMYNDLKPKLDLYNDYENIYELIPQLKDALWTIRDNILSPDDFSKFVLNIIVNNSEVKLGKLADQVKKKYKLNRKTKKIVEKTLLYGEQFVSVISYKEAFEKMIKQKDEAGHFRTIREATIMSKLSESITTDSEIKNISKDTKGLSIKFLEGVDNIVHTQIKNKYNFILESQKDVNDPTPKKTFDFNKVSATDGTIPDKKIDVNVDGSYVKILDIKKIVPIIINEECLGYYYIEAGDDVLNSNNIYAGMSRINLKDAMSAKEEYKDKIYNNLASLIYDNLDKKFIENNKNLKKSLYEILRYYEAVNKDIKVIYLRPDEVIHFKINEDEEGRGRSIFYDVLFTAKIYLALMITNTMARLTRKYDKRIFYVKDGVNKEVGRSIQNSLIQLKKDQGSISSINHISRIMGFAGRFLDLFIPVSEDGNKPIDFDIMAGQDVEMKDEFIEMIERVMVNGVGVPSALYNNYSQEVDFARTLSMMNGKFIRFIVSFQLDIEDPLTIMVKRIIDLEENYENVNIDSIIVQLPSPTTLNLTNSIDMYTQVDTMVTNIINTEFGENPPENAPVQQVKKQLIRKFMPNIDWKDIDEIIKKAKLSKTLDDNADTGNEEDSGY